MDKRYWIGRKRAAIAMARAASSAEARLIQHGLAGHYSVGAARGVPFLLPAKGPATSGERIALERPVRAPDGPAGDRR